MILSFRQGLVQFPTGFLSKVGTTVNLVTSNGPVVFTASYGTAEYLVTEPSNQGTLAAWLNVPVTQSSWLYWDINKNTGIRTFGLTLIAPVFGTQSALFPPFSTIQVDQHWFDTDSFKMKVWSGTAWVEYIRVFVGQVQNGTVLVPNSAGSQVGTPSGVYESGKILFDGYGKALKKSNKAFLTSADQFFVDGSNVQSARLENAITTAQADASIVEYQVVKLSTFGRISPASYADTGSALLAISTESGTYDSVVNISFQGLITNPNWNWTTVNAQLWVDTNGSLTDVDPHIITPTLVPQVPVARVYSPTSVMFMQGLGGLGPTGPRGPAGANAVLASSSIIGTSRLSVSPVDPLTPIAVGDNDPRNSNARTPTAHTHNASEVSTQAYGNLTGSNVQMNLQQLNDQKLDLTGGILTGSLILNGDPTSNLQAATKHYVDSLSTGLRWIDPVDSVNLVGDNITTPPTSPNFADMYIVPTGGTGSWSGLSNHLVRWTGSVWEDLGVWLTGRGSSNRRFGVSAYSNTPASGTFAGKDNQIAIWAAITQTWSYYSPSNSDAFYVQNDMSLFKYQQFTYDAAQTRWISFGGPQAIIPGNQLTLVGNTLNVVEGSGSGLDADTLDGLDSTAFSLVNHNHNGTYVRIVGDTMTGPLVLSGNPTTNLQAATKQYVDSTVGVATTTAGYVHTQSVSSNLWSITHNLNTTDLQYSVYVTIGGVQTIIAPALFTFVDNNTVQINFTQSYTGKVVFIAVY